MIFCSWASFISILIITTPKTNEGQWKIHHEWRCISYWKWWCSNVMLGFRDIESIFIFHSFPPFFSVKFMPSANPSSWKLPGIYYRQLPKKCPAQVKPLLGAVWTPKPSDFTEPLEKVPWNPKVPGGMGMWPCLGMQVFWVVSTLPKTYPKTRSTWKSAGPSYKEFILQPPIFRC